MSARVYFMKTVNGCTDVSIMSPQEMNSEDGQVYFVCILYNRMQSKYKQTNCEHSRRNSYGLQLS